MLLSNLNLLATAPGGVARLRELILTLAVQGKLLPQNLQDEPASVLLKKIREVKDRLIVEGKIKRDKPLAAIAEDEKPFGLPRGWEWVRFGDVVGMLNGYAFKSEWFKPAGVRLLRNVNIGHGRVDWTQPEFIDATMASEFEQFALQEGDVVLTLDRPIISTGLKLAVLTVTDLPCFLLQRVARLAPEPKVMSQEFLVLWMKSDLFMNTIDPGRSTGVPHISTKQVGNLVVGLPPLAEQIRIVTRVEELMRLCDALETKGQLAAAQHAQLVSTLLGTLTDSATPDALAENWQRIASHFDLLLDRPQAVDTLEQTILQLAVRGLLVPQDPSDEPARVLLQAIRTEKDRLIAAGQIKRDKPLPPIADDEQPFALPLGWEWVRLREIVTHLGDGLHGTPHYTTSGDYFFINGNNLKNGSIVIKPETKRVDQVEFEKYKKPLDERSVLLSINGTLGSIAFYREEPVVLGKSACYFNLAQQINKPLIKILFESVEFQHYADEQATGNTIRNLGLKAVSEFVIGLPPLPEQSRIVTRVESLRRLCADLRQRLSASQSTQAQLAEALVQNAALPCKTETSDA